MTPELAKAAARPLAAEREYGKDSMHGKLAREANERSETIGRRVRENLRARREDPKDCAVRLPDGSIAMMRKQLADKLLAKGQAQPATAEDAAAFDHLVKAIDQAARESGFRRTSTEMRTFGIRLARLLGEK